MYSIFSSLTWRPKPSAARSRLCSRDSAWTGEFSRSAMSSVSSAFVIVCTGYFLLLSFASLNNYDYYQAFTNEINSGIKKKQFEVDMPLNKLDQTSQNLNDLFLLSFSVSHLILFVTNLLANFLHLFSS